MSSIEQCRVPLWWRAHKSLERCERGNSLALWCYPHTDGPVAYLTTIYRREKMKFVTRRNSGNLLVYAAVKTTHTHRKESLLCISNTRLTWIVLQSTDQYVSHETHSQLTLQKWAAIAEDIHDFVPPSRSSQWH